MKIITFLLFAGVLGWSQTGKTETDPLGSGNPYVLGAGDEFELRATNVDEISGKPFRIEPDGGVTMPMLGTTHPGGLTVEQYEKELLKLLAAYVREPQVTLIVTRFRTETVTLSGAFQKPGIYHLQGRHTLAETLADAGGLADNASRILRVVRQTANGPIPLASSRLRADGLTSSAQLDISPANGRSSADDFVLQPNDLVTAFASEPIIVGGEIVRPGVVALGEHASLPLLQVIFMSGGLTKDASQKHVKIFRQHADSNRSEEIDVNLARIEKGSEPDVELLPHDLLIIPRSDGRVASRQVLALSTGIALAAISTMMLAMH